MIYKVIVLDEAKQDIALLKKSEIGAYNKVMVFLEELQEHPHAGTGKPEMLKYGKLKGLWSRRITRKHRLVYAIKDNEIIVLVLSVSSHYGDK